MWYSISWMFNHEITLWDKKNRCILSVMMDCLKTYTLIYTWKLWHFSLILVETHINYILKKRSLRYRIVTNSEEDCEISWRYWHNLKAKNVFPMKLSQIQGYVWYSFFTGGNIKDAQTCGSDMVNCVCLGTGSDFQYLLSSTELLLAWVK